MKRLKIGLFLDSFFPAVDGVVMVVDNLAKCMSKFADVTVVVPDNESTKEDNKRPYKVIRLKSIHLPTTEYRVALPITKSSKMFKELLKEKFDIIHIHSPFTIGKLGIKLARVLDIPVIATMHTRFDFEFRKYFKFDVLVKLALKTVIKVFDSCDKCISVNKAVGKVFKDYGYHGEPIPMYNATDMKLIEDGQAGKRMINERFGLKESDIVFLFVGRITEIKNIFFILGALNILKSKNFSFKMMYVGTGPDERKLKEKIESMQMQNEVMMCGKITDRELLKAIYYRADLFLFPSLFDASSLVQIEAASQKTPTLLIEGAVTADTITNNENGYTAQNEEKKYAERILEIMSNKKQYEEVCEKAHLQLARTWEELAKDTYDYYLSAYGDGTI